MSSQSRTLAVSAVASASGLALLGTPWWPVRWAGALLGAAGAAATGWTAYRLSRPAVAPSLSPSVETVAQPVAPVLPEQFVGVVARLRQDETLAGVAQEEVAALLRDVTTNATELLRATTSVRSVMEQVERSVQAIEAGSRDQSGRLTDAAGHAEESAASVAVIADEAVQLADMARQTAQSARSGAGLLEEAGGVVSGLGAVVGQSNAAMERLAGLSTQIGSLVDIIAGVAKQSNLLALNAAIEAARAGANGRSFGVVAEAMRDLANRAAGAASEAASLIAQVQAETHLAAEAVAVGSRQVESGTQLMERVVSDLRAILEQTAAVEGVMVAISEHAQVADDAARHLAEQITAVAEVSAQTSAEAVRMAASSREASASVKAIAHVSRHYAQVPGQVRSSLVPLERTLAHAGDLVTGLEAVLPPAKDAGAVDGATEVSYADWQPWENCRTWWHLDEFMATHPEIRLRHLHLGNADFDGQLALPEAPDVTWAAPDWAPQLLQPLDDLIERDRFDLSSFVPGVVESLRRLGDGRTYGLPMHLNMPQMVYNKNLFERAGVPVPRPGITWEELLPGLERIKERCGVHGIEIDMRNAHFLPFALHFLAPAGAPLMSDDGARVLRGALVEEKLQFLYDLSQRGLMVPYDQLWAPVRPFVKGEVAVLIGSTATLLFTPIREMAARGELNFVPEVAAHPTFRAHPGVAPAANFHLVGIHRFAKDREASWRLVQHLITNPERIRGDILRWGQAPVQYNDGVKAAYAELGRQGAPTQYLDIWKVKTAPLPPYILTPGFRRLETVAGHEMALLMAGQKTPSELMGALVEALGRK